MGASRRVRRRITRRSQRDENQMLRAQLAATTEALEAYHAAPTFEEDLSDLESLEASGFTVFDSPEALEEPTPSDSEESAPTGYDPDLSAAFRRVTGQ